MPGKILILISVCLVVLLPKAQGQTADSCEQLAAYTIPGVVLEISSAVTVASAVPPASPFAPPLTEPLPAYCRVDGMIDRRTGVDNQPYGIGFALALPDNWNGRFLFQGGGGLNGTIALPLGQAATAGTPALSRGFAVVSTDSGHQSTTGFDAGFFADQEASINFFYQAIGKVTVVAKQILAAYYGQPAEHSYYAGCSTGGREAMLMTQRYPNYYDGVIAGAPAMRTDYSNLAMRSVIVAFNKIAPRDASGRPMVADALSSGDKQLIMAALLDACDADDGLADGMISDPTGCLFQPAALTCEGEKSDSCLTPVQVNMLTTAMAGPRDSRGRQVYPGYFYDTGIDADGRRGLPGVLFAGQSPVGPPVFATEQDIDGEADAAARSMNSLGDSHLWTNLSSFSGHGGKLIFYHGVSDPWFSALDTVQYYQRLTRDNGGAGQVRSWSRLFLVPGMGHCRGGAAALDSFDLLDAITRWVEEDRAPESVTATGRALPGRSRPLCPYPAHAHYLGQGDPEDAGSFTCRE